MDARTLVGWLALVSAAALGCSGGGSPNGLGSGDDSGGPNVDASSGSTSSGSGSSSGSNLSPGGGSSSGSASSSGAQNRGPSGMSSGGPISDAGGLMVNDGAAAAIDPETDLTQTKTIEMTSFTVHPGEELYRCQTFANPWGKTVDVKSYALDMSTGSHHMFAFYQQKATNGALTPCSGTLFGAFTFTAQIPKIAQTYPAAVGATIPQTTGFNLQVHYLNTGTTDIQTSVKLTMYVAKPNVVTQHAGVIFLNNTNINIPPGGGVDNNSYTLPQDVTILQSMSHMHRGATQFKATVGGQPLFSTTDWAEPPPQSYAPPLKAAFGTPINWSCTYTNTTKQNLTFGESAQTNVMCISVSIFYPVMDVNNPVIATQMGGSGFGLPGH